MRNLLSEGNALPWQYRSRHGAYAVLLTGDLFYARFIDECEAIGAFLTDPLSGASGI